MSSSIGEPVVKRLFYENNGSCAFPGCEVRSIATSGRVSVHMAHIEGEKKGSARYRENQPRKERNEFQNLLLLCPSHHAKVDSKEERADYPKEDLFDWKTASEHVPSGDDLSDPQIADAIQICLGVSAVADTSGVSVVNLGDGNVNVSVGETALASTTPTEREPRLDPVTAALLDEHFETLEVLEEAMSEAGSSIEPHVRDGIAKLSSLAQGEPLVFSLSSYRESVVALQAAVEQEFFMPPSGPKLLSINKDPDRRKRREAESDSEFDARTRILNGSNVRWSTAVMKFVDEHRSQLAELLKGGSIDSLTFKRWRDL